MTWSWYMTTPLSMKVATLLGNSACNIIKWLMLLSKCMGRCWWLPCQKEWSNSEDSFTVKVAKGKVIVCHFPTRNCTICLMFLGLILCWVAGSAAWLQCAQFPQNISSKKFQWKKFLFHENFPLCDVNITSVVHNSAWCVQYCSVYVNMYEEMLAALFLGGIFRIVFLGGT